MKNLVYLSFILLMSCGIQHEIDDSEQDINANIDLKYEEVAAFCDERYGEGSEAAEACFLDYRQFLKVKVGVDLDSIIEYCSKYEYEEDVEDCEEDLINLVEGLE